MKIVLICDMFSENMGYANNSLPKYLALLGHEVHVLTSNLHSYDHENFYKEVYATFHGPKETEFGFKIHEGFTLHRMPHEIVNSKLKLCGLYSKLKGIRPDVVQTFSIEAETTFQSAVIKPILGYKLFTANHTVISVFPPAQKALNMKFNVNETKSTTSKSIDQVLSKKKVNRFTFNYLKNGLKNHFPTLFKPWHYTIKVCYVNFVTNLCYPATVDAEYIANKFYHVPKAKCKLNLLGVDTEIFKPVEGQIHITERKKIREDLGISDNEILCIYTGRFTFEKNPQCLAEAIGKLIAENKPYKALFIGNGPQTEMIKAHKGCIVLPFVHFKELAKYYRASDIGVWPCQESTSVLDCTACGLPVVISDQVLATDRKEGNGLTYRENDPDDLKKVLLKLESKNYRDILSEFGINKIKLNHLWYNIAQNRISDYTRN